jgi:hypothetical protein
MERERVARGALLAVRRDNRYLAQRLGGSYETLEAVRENPVVIRAEETHQWCAPVANRQSVLTIRAESATGRKWLRMLAA